MERLCKKKGFKRKLENATRNVNNRLLVQDQSMTMEKSWVMMMHQTDKKQRVRGSLFHK